MSRTESFDRKVLAAAFVRARELLGSFESVAAAEALQLEETLRPLASAAEIQQVVVPLLDKAELFGLAMAWDSGADSKSAEWLLTRVERWLALCAPEFAFLTLCELNRLHTPNAYAAERAHAALGVERELRATMLHTNLSAVAAIDPELVRNVLKAHRTSVALRPLGVGLAEFAGPGQPWVQLWAVTPSGALAEAEALLRRSGAQSECFIAGVGDCTLPSVAARLFHADERRIHIVDLHVARVRAMLEIVDLSVPLRERRILIHAGPRAIETLGPFAQSALSRPESVVGGDTMAISLLRAAAGLEPLQG